MSPIKRTGLALCLLILAFAGGSEAIKAKSKPEPFPLVADSGPKPAVETYHPKDMSQAGLVKALEARVISLEAELKERKQAANHWYAQAKEYKALCQRQNNYQPASYALGGHYETRCQNGQCKRVWVADKPAQPAKKAAPAKQAANCATGNCAPATSRRVFAGRWFR